MLAPALTLVHALVVYTSGWGVSKIKTGFIPCHSSHKHQYSCWYQEFGLGSAALNQTEVLDLILTQDFLVRGVQWSFDPKGGPEPKICSK